MEVKDGESGHKHILAEHAKASGNLAKSRQEPMPGLIADTELEASWAPVNELDGLSGT